jgi:hypothetical protein
VERLVVDRLTDADLTRLLALCDAATPGEWLVEPGYNNAGSPTGFFYIPGHNDANKVEMLWTDSEFIAATDPATVRALVEEVRRLRAAVESQQRVIDEQAEWVTDERTGLHGLLGRAAFHLEDMGTEPHVVVMRESLLRDISEALATLPPPDVES